MSHLTQPPTTTIEEFSEEEIDNNDMDIDAASLGRMEPHVRAAMGEPKIKLAFEYHEAKANAYKAWHTWIGTISLILLILALNFGLLRLVADRFGFASALESYVAPATVIGSIPFLCAALLRIFRVHKRWVLSRFRAERIRHWKFHQLLDGDYIERLSLDPTAEDRVFNDQWGDFEKELKAKDQMEEYVQRKPFDSSFLYAESEDHAFNQREVFHSAARVFFNSRLRFQHRWFMKQSKRFRRSDVWTKRTAGWLLILSVMAAFGEGMLHFFGSAAAREQYGLKVAALGIALALFSAGFRVYRSASGLSENAERYQRMFDQIRWYEARFAQLLRKKVHEGLHQKEMLNIMEAIERLCHGELVEFVRVALKSEYLF